MSLGGALPNVRRMYRARRGWKLVHADKSQGELWVMAAITKDPVLLAELRAGDVYTELAKGIYKLPAHLTKCKCKDVSGSLTCQKPNEHVKPQARKQAKIGRLAWQYATSFETFWVQMLEDDMSITELTARAIYNGLGQRQMDGSITGHYRRTVEWWYEEQQRVRSRRPMYSNSRILDRRLYYPADPILNKLVNQPIQSTLADDVDLWMLDLRRELREKFTRKSGRQEARIIIDLHDAVDVEAKDEIVDDVAEVVKRTGEQPRIIEGREWTLKVDLKVGESWDQV
jgi:DNA polymerase I-like protein with 3'-5' exonuclease and polymerase domains